MSSLYLTRGEAGIAGKSHDEAARIRTAESEEACRILHPQFGDTDSGAAPETWKAVVALEKLIATTVRERTHA